MVVYRGSLRIILLNKAFVFLNISSYVLSGLISPNIFDEQFSFDLLFSYAVILSGFLMTLF